ncbi:MAG: tRNA (adenosine(37)-N6)-threonylcarbamoyltransferase complex ATPase subunit type 1 TsaE [Dehalococcoidia bacterium]|nr:tRNA (adenosine(37)-N6)-threonylcarbamoyltransferase complex ATPase subunit type 1 TsaE [Dehalococcoidia bacterium]
MDSFSIITHSPDQTRRLGTMISNLANGHDIYLLSGNLGTGKTHLVQGIAFGLGIKEYACSPSFMIAREYHGRLNLYHLDLYRLDHIEEIVDLGIDEYFKDDAICAIEWAEKGSEALPSDNLTIKMEHLPDDNRKITFLPLGLHYEELVKHLRDLIEKDRDHKWN